MYTFRSRWFHNTLFVLALGALIAVVAFARGGGSDPDSPLALQDRPAVAGAEEEEEEEPRGGDNYFSLQRAAAGVDVEAKYTEAVAQAREVASLPQPAGVPSRFQDAWELVGPTNVGGRISSLAVDPTQPDTIYAAAASGGVWKSTDAGTTFQSVWPDNLPQGVGAVAVTPEGQIWVGTGEAQPGGGSSTYPGDGIYVSDDGGETWKNRGLKRSTRIARIVVDPTDSDRLWVAAGGPLFAGGGDRGIYRTENGGRSWQLVLAPETSTAGGNEISIDPTNPDRIFATMWDRIRTPSHRTYGGLGSGLFRSLDGGDTWERLDNVVTPTPSDDVGLGRSERLSRIGVAVAPSEPDTVWVVSGSYGGFGSFKGYYVSRDGGDTFNTTAARPNPGGDLWWTGQIWVDPANENHVLIPGVNLPRTTNGGQTWQNSGGMHVDHHAIAWDPAVPNRVYEGNDGGVYRSDQNAASQSWVKATHEPYTQHYTIDVAELDPSRISSGTQDNGCIRSWEPDRPPASDSWEGFGCGDGLYTPIDYSDPDIFYGCSQYGACFRRNEGTSPVTNRNIQSGTVSTRRNWKTPLVLDPNNPEILYYGGNVLNRSTDRGNTWTAISPISEPLPGLPTDLDPVYTNYGTITTIAVAKTAPDTIYVGTDTGRVWKTENAGGSWTEFADVGLPDRWVSAIAIDPTDEKRVFVTFTGFFQGDESAHVHTTGDGGVRWQDISGNLPNAPTSDIVIDKARATVYVATDVGVYNLQNADRTTRAGTLTSRAWRRVGTDLPLAPVLDLRLHQPTGELFAATFGRGTYSISLDD